MPFAPPPDAADPTTLREWSARHGLGEATASALLSLTERLSEIDQITDSDVADLKLGAPASPVLIFLPCPAQRLAAGSTR